MFSSQLPHIIAIGASAGGMEEINTFFDHTPLDGVSYVIVQHLSPDFKSRMVSKHSKVSEIYGRLHHDVEGQGIGLYLAKKLVDPTDGNIKVENEPGKGSKFIICFKTEPHRSKIADAVLN
ncbi:MAG TPA: chemotaxis protein CheB [Segetibacter sp.]